MVAFGVARQWFAVVSGDFHGARYAQSARQNVWFGEMEAPKNASDPNLSRFDRLGSSWVRFGCIWDPFGIRFRSLFDAFWVRLGTVGSS